MRRLVVSASLAYLLVAFGFTILTLLNASELDTTDRNSLVVIARADARVIFAMSLIGIAVTILLALRILIDGKRRLDLERQMREPRRRSDATGPDRPA